MRGSEGKRGREGKGRDGSRRIVRYLLKKLR
jgi:hypothetical protein